MEKQTTSSSAFRYRDNSLCRACIDARKRAKIQRCIAARLHSRTDYNTSRYCFHWFHR